MSKGLSRKQKIGLLVLLVLLTIGLYSFLKRKIRIIDKIDILPRSSTLKYSTRTLDKIQQIVVHHSASIGQNAEDYARYHVESRKWPGIGYHFVIETDGSIIQGNHLETISYNTQDNNTKSIGICLSGDFTKQEPTPAQIKSLKELIPHLRNLLKKELPVSGHKDHAPTSCPGPNLYKFISQFN